jgi:hypothetical protein
MFFKKKKDDEEYRANIKSSMDEELPFELENLDIPQIETQPPRYQPPAGYQRRMPQDDIAAPLFVKVEKYKELLVTIQEMKIFISSIRELITIINEADHIKDDALKMLRASVQRMEKNLVEIDTDLMRPRGIDIEVTKGDIEVRQVQSSLDELQHQLANLKKELHEMK